MKLLRIKTTATAAIEEFWEIPVPDDFDPTEEEGLDVLSAAIEAAGTGNIEVRMEVQEEWDRELEWVREDAPPVWPSL